MSKHQKKPSLIFVGTRISGRDYAELAKAAEENHRSLSGEIRARLAAVHQAEVESAKGVYTPGRD